MNPQKATFAAGCFWGVQEAFRDLPGITSTTSGYTGGTLENPTYEQVCTGTTGHAETVNIAFDQDLINYTRLLKKFWEIHNPTQKNRQGNDVGSQYRSAIFYHSEEQKRAAQESKAEEQKKYQNPIVTEITTAQKFHKAEKYHQNYLQKNPRGYCHTNLQ
jgi:peptide-methionine (S)-S-oxide reductase